MWPDLVIALSSALNQYQRLSQGVEDLPSQQFVSPLAVVAVFPRAAGLDIQRLYPNARQPLADHGGGELCPVVGADTVGRPAFDEQLSQAMQHIVGASAWRPRSPGTCVCIRRSPSACGTTALSRGAQKLGQPGWLSNFVVEEKRSIICKYPFGIQLGNLGWRKLPQPPL